MSDYVPQVFNRFGFIPHGDPIAAFCHATERYDPDHYARWDGNGAEATPAGDLVHVLWSGFDATSCVTVLHGDAVMHLCIYSEIAIYDGILHLGPLAIDLASSDLRFLESGTSGMDFVLDGTPLRITYPGRIIDMTYHFARELTHQVLRMWQGEVSHIVVTRGERRQSFGRDDVRLYHGYADSFAVRLGSFMLVRPDRGPTWSFENGVSDGIDLDGVPVRIEVVPTAGHAAGVSYPGPFDEPLPEVVEPVARVPYTRSIMGTSEKRGPAVRGAASVNYTIGSGGWPEPIRSQTPRRGLGRPGLAQAS